MVTCVKVPVTGSGDLGPDPVVSRWSVFSLFLRPSDTSG